LAHSPTLRANRRGFPQFSRQAAHKEKLIHSLRVTLSLRKHAQRLIERLPCAISVAAALRREPCEDAPAPPGPNW
jgi:hypothetical protein